MDISTGVLGFDPEKITTSWIFCTSSYDHTEQLIKTPQSSHPCFMYISNNTPWGFRVERVNTKEILTGLEVNMQFCCPEEWEYSTRRSRVEYSHYEGQQNCIFTENGPVNISIIIFCILKKSRWLLLYFTYVIAIISVVLHVWYFLDYKPLWLITVVGLSLRTEWGSNISTRGLSIKEPPPPQAICEYKPPPCT